jgi:biopolymer transport protein ExbD
MKIARKEKETKIPSDSMADIAFLLIIFFMLTTTFSVNKGFDFGIPPLEAEASESESRPALTIIVDSLNDVNRNYRVIVVDEQGQQQDFRANDVGRLYDYMLGVFDDVKAQQPGNWWKLPVYVLVRRDAPFEGFVDVWQQVQKVEEKLKVEIPADDEQGQKLATHIPHVDQVEDIINSYLAQGKLIL